MHILSDSGTLEFRTIKDVALSELFPDTHVMNFAVDEATEKADVINGKRPANPILKFDSFSDGDILRVRDQVRFFHDNAVRV
jgi:hypothetical protein